MRMGKRLALLVGIALSITAISPSGYIMASETGCITNDSLYILEDNLRTTGSVVEIETGITTSSATLLVWNTKFDKNELSEQKEQVKFQVENGRIQSIMQDEITLIPEQDYSVSDDIITIEKSYLVMLPVGQHTFNFQVVNDQSQENNILIQEIQCIDTTAIYHLIEEAEYLISEAIIGTDVGSYHLKDELIFKMAIAYAKEELEQVKHQEQVDAIYTKLEQSIKIFKNCVICDENELDKTELNELLQQAEKLHTTVKVGNKPGMCHESSKIALQIVIVDCKEMMESANNQNSIDETVKDLKIAINLFMNSIISFQTEDVNQDGKVDIQDLALVMYYYRIQDQDESWEIAQKADINQDGVINLVDLVEVAHKVLEK